MGAAATHGLTVAMVLGFALLFVAVMALGWLAWQAKAADRHWWIVAGGIVLPLVTATAIFAGSSWILRAVDGERPSALTIDVTGHQFWWDVVYDPEGLAIRDANEIVVPVGVPVKVVLRSDDVIHSFWLPRMA